MDNHGIKGIIFDLGNVLIDFDHRIAARRISAFTKMKPEEIFNLFFDSELTGLFEEGKISPEDFFARVKKMLGLSIGYEEFVPIWNEIFFFSEKNRLVLNLAEELKKTFKVALLSNINTLHFEYVKKIFPVFGAFHHIIASCDVGLRKPQRQIYLKTLDILKVGAQNTFYTDDRPELVESARSLGIRSFVFSSFGKLENDLASLGIRGN